MHGSPRFLALAEGWRSGLVFINQFMSINFHYQSIEFNQKMYWSPCLYKYKLLWKLIMKFNVKKKIKASYWTSSTAFVSWRLVHVSWWTTSKVAATRSFRFLWYSVFFKYINRAVLTKAWIMGSTWLISDLMKAGTTRG